MGPNRAHISVLSGDDSDMLELAHDTNFHTPDRSNPIGPYDGDTCFLN